MIVKTCGDQPRMTVWPCSTMRERPLRMSASRASMPLDRAPISALMTKMPPSVTSSIRIRKAQPWSPPIVPESSARIKLAQAASAKLIAGSPAGAMPSRLAAEAASSTITSDSAKSQRTSAPLPRSKVESMA